MTVVESKRGNKTITCKGCGWPILSQSAAVFVELTGKSWSSRIKYHKACGEDAQKEYDDAHPKSE